MLKRLSVLLGLTETEIKVLLFLLSSFILGFGYKTLFLNEDRNNGKTFDYSKEDSIFFSIGNDTDSAETYNEEDKSVDYKREVLDFNESNFTGSKTDQTPEVKSININTAKLENLILLPGIGEKTAERILEMREQRNGFKTLKELLEVKGIGEIKFKKIEKYLFIKRNFNLKPPEGK
jgi:competence ComEA-like helix-hairpin-helix protein